MDPGPTRKAETIKGLCILLLLALFPSLAHAHPKKHKHPKPPSPWQPIGLVWITGYDDWGQTFTGAQAGPGGCAISPAWYPLGTRFRLHLGTSTAQCTANDTGGLVGPGHIDLWVSTAGAADAITGWHPVDVHR